MWTGSESWRYGCDLLIHCLSPNKNGNHSAGVETERSMAEDSKDTCNLTTMGSDRDIASLVVGEHTVKCSL